MDRLKRDGVRPVIHVLCVAVLTWVGSARAQTAAPSEYEVKAAFLLNFAQFVEWPPHAFTSADAPITVGVLGEDPFGSMLEKTLGGETVHGRTLVVRRSQQVEDLKGAQMVFVARSERDRLAEVLTALGDTPALTIGETDGFARRGGVINFYIDDNRVRFEINAAAAERKQLHLSAELLKRARIVGPLPGSAQR